MPRTSDGNVREIMEVDATISTLSPFIAMANVQVTKHCTGYDEVADLVLLELIERNLAAHHLCMRDPRLSSDSAGPVSNSYLTPTAGPFLMATVFGQTAILLDHKGGLAELQSRREKGNTPFKIGWSGGLTQSQALEQIRLRDP